MADDKLPISVSLYITGKYLDSVIQGSSSDLDLHLVLAMACSYNNNFDKIFKNTGDEHQSLSNQMLKWILEQTLTNKKLPAMGGLENKLIVLMAKAFKTELSKVNNSGEYNLKF